MKKRRPEISTSRAVSVYRDMLSYRSIYCNDRKFFRMSDFWAFLAEDNTQTKIKTYRTNDVAEYKRKAGVISFDGKATLVVDEQLLENAEKGCKFSNTILAHEFAHLALGHHDRNAAVKNFQLFETETGMANIPPTLEELEANIAAIYFQCGVALLDPVVRPLDLAHRACADVSLVTQVKNFCNLSVFQSELKRQSYGIERVVL